MHKIRMDYISFCLAHAQLMQKLCIFFKNIT
ncbi:CLUMA_CG012706, isoform A [Clunio marinus]|uniref:CLUMA_CG012706, isoform A n=1 Tax=Clunio marinus TaxID=568069 RepID=A0A1J1IGH8_9DIPT|nr:CLUMA_CG012706, isoform A [Clunio marinus]